MSNLHFQTIPLLAVNLGPENPLPAIALRPTPRLEGSSSPVLEDVVANMVTGHVPFLYPYTFQDGYNRELAPVKIPIAVLENEFLRATFLLPFGGRLWSLIHKPSGQELLAVNPTPQLANLALRNAWFAGGVEWNIGTTGHSPLTCSPLFATQVEGEAGMPILRLYEWERLRETPFQIDAFLPDESPFIYLGIRILNPQNHPTSVYWWSNIAVPESEGVRVLSPANAAYKYSAGRARLQEVPVPGIGEADFTYGTTVEEAGDYFFLLDDTERPWITALDRAGKGLIQVSSRRMIGRKLWLWGKGTGGQNWQRFLSPGGMRYIEIQAGLTRTQFEHPTMPAHAEWTWLEAYGRLEVAPDVIQGEDWPAARHEVEASLDRILPQAELEKRYGEAALIFDVPPTEIPHRGSGWGALERRRRERAGEPGCFPSGMVFGDDSLSSEQAVWIQLIERGILQETDPQTPPSAFVRGESWRRLLEESLDAPDGQNWTAWYYLGLQHYIAGDMSGARDAWQRSLALIWTPWAQRNIALLLWEQGNLDEAADAFQVASRETPEHLPLLIECGRCMLAAGRPREWLDHLKLVPVSSRRTGRIRLLEAQAAQALGELETVGKFFTDGVVVTDLREGECSLSDLWFAYQTERLAAEEQMPNKAELQQQVVLTYPVPLEFDFRIDAKSGGGS